LQGKQMRVAVTGLGCITPIGNSVERFRDAMYAGRSGIAVFPTDMPGARPGDRSFRFTTTATVKGFDPSQYFGPSVLMVTDRSAQFGMVAAQQAVAESGLFHRYDPASMAVVTGCSCGGRAADEDANRELYTRNARVPPTVILRTMASSGASHISAQYGVTGPVLNLATACASGTHAIGMAFQMVRSGMASAAIAGGHEAPLTFGFLRAWDSMRVVSPTSCRPFSADRDGMTLGEGGAMLVLEPLDEALARGAHVYAEIVGFGMSADAHHITQPRAAGAALAIARALGDAKQAGVQDAAVRVGYINAHGTGTLANDAIEAEAIRTALGDAAADAPVGSTKSLTGHGIGAAGAIEAMATVLALDAGRLPYTTGVTNVDPALKLDVVVNEPRAMNPERDLALSNSLAFGGLNAVLVFRRLVP
jgi:3-oxoacyl-[acyl-carrier-protein] synthase II/nodulation protein E